MADWQPLEGSSAIEATRFDPSTGELEIRFKSGGETKLLNVPASVAQALRDSPSAGSFYHKQLRGRYRTAADGEVSDGRRSAT